MYVNSNKNMDIQRLVILIILLFTAYYFFVKKEEGLENTSDDLRTQHDKACSQKSINEAFLTWVFGSPQTVR